MIRWSCWLCQFQINLVHYRHWGGILSRGYLKHWKFWHSMTIIRPYSGAHGPFRDQLSCCVFSHELRNVMWLQWASMTALQYILGASDELVMAGFTTKLVFVFQHI